ncbi:Gmad2 immunoglobulin-like domain-containing protein [Calidifontibacillus oryziterrae]|uniref:Gmad2 immunoglobulin-like domain-containing protein n=1 Tax=Calidifontibacillus oryziterrae TaxID=1191699 RepID=UPI0002D7E1F9|nr:Gmad2 immunoglobulin-like domain-containing protein [Calidifontibacillus oryziterrae]
MKLNKFYMYIVLVALIFTAACGTATQNNENSTDPTNRQTIENEQVENRDNENQQEEIKDDNQDDDENNAFRNIEATGEKGNYVVKGEARVFEGVFFYAVEEGHNYLIEETKVEVAQGAPTWEPFELNITIPEDQLPNNGTLTLTLYEHSAKDNTEINYYNVKLDQFQP